MADTITIRPTTARDLPAIDALLAASYPALLKRDYAPSVLVTALPLISRANPALLRSGTYFVAEDETGRALAAGGWTRAAPEGGPDDAETRMRATTQSGPVIGPVTGHIRHVATHPAYLRQGLAQAILTQVLAGALAAGVERMICLSTQTAVPFYRAMGFSTRGPVQVTLRPGIVFPAVGMVRAL